MKVVSSVKHVWLIYRPDSSLVIINPGVNLNVPEDILTHPDFISRQKAGKVQAFTAAKDFKEMESNELIQDIAKIYDVKTLELILKEDERIKVQKAAQDQLDEIRKGEPREKDKDKKK